MFIITMYRVIHIKVYIDLVVLLNFVFDTVLLCSVNYILKRNVSIMKIVCGSFVGEISIVVLWISNYYLSFIIKIILSFLVLFVTFGYRDLSYFIKNVTYFYLVSMLLGGGIYFFQNEFKIPYFVIIIIGLFVFMKWIKNICILKNYSSYYYSVDLYINPYEHFKMNAYLDSGNCLKDPYFHRDIILVNKDLIQDRSNVIYVPFSSLNHSDLLVCINGYKLEIEGKENKKFLIGLSEDKIMMNGIDCVISMGILEGLR